MNNTFVSVIKSVKANFLFWPTRRHSLQQPDSEKLVAPQMARYICNFPYRVHTNPTYIAAPTRTLRNNTICFFKKFPTCFDVYYIILRGTVLVHYGTAEASQSLTGLLRLSQLSQTGTLECFLSEMLYDFRSRTEPVTYGAPLTMVAWPPKHVGVTLMQIYDCKLSAYLLVYLNSVKICTVYNNI
jgi:hypothetical protein